MSTTTSTLPTQTPITTLLVANRGEIARRIIHTARQLGIRTVAVHSTPDSDSLFVHDADVSVHLPGASPAETYLRSDLLIQAAQVSGATAIHPGYGFLSENAEFAAAVQAAGLIWVGPSPEAIATMGSKLESKEIMKAAGVPVLEQLDPAVLTDADLPVLIKASSGGGGRGMRVVESLGDLDDAVASAQSEAASAFGDDTVFCEHYLPTGHHVEVQVMADHAGNVWVLGERECSIQRRHQKIVEETPSPLVERHPEMRDDLFAAAEAAVRAISYVGAGTVEFLATEDGRFFFLEMNTRLQVEHPVTECVWGVDLVAEQIRVAEGGTLGERPTPSGHAIEVRLYGEDPAQNWQPQHGAVHRFELGVDHSTFSGPIAPGLRLDSAIGSGSAVSIHYDPMVAKLIAMGTTREDAVRRLIGGLTQLELHGPITNRDTLISIVSHPAFVAGMTPTSFLDDHDLGALTQPRVSRGRAGIAAAAAALAETTQYRESVAGSRSLPVVSVGWRNLPSQPLIKQFATPQQGAEWEVSYTFDAIGGEWSASVGEIDSEGDSSSGPDIEVIEVSRDVVVFALDGVQHRFGVHRYTEPTASDPHQQVIYVDTIDGPVRCVRLPRFPDASEHLDAGTLSAPMPGMVARIGVSVGDQVEAGQALLWIEAMKMEHQILAPTAGVVSDIFVDAQQQVDEGQVLVHITSEDDCAVDDGDETADGDNVE